MTVGKPQVAYRQTLAQGRSSSRRATSSRRAAAASSPSSTCKYEPLTKEQVEEWTTYQEEQGEKPDPNNIYFMDKIVGGVVPKEYIPSVEAGLPRRDASRGPSTASSAWTCSATLLDGKYHDVD